MNSAIVQHRNEIAGICQRFGVRRLDVFGSAARSIDFDADTSDIDFLIEFGVDSPADLNSFFGTKSALEELLGRPVDLVELASVRNPFVRADIERDRETVYAS